MGLFLAGLGLLKILSAAFFILLIVRLVLLAADALHERRERLDAGRAELVLRRRFADGEIQAAEYRERLAVLRD